MQRAAVITGDIVNSTLLGRPEIRKLTRSMEIILKGHLFEFYRGDSFQIYIKNPKEALSLALRVRSVARTFSGNDVRCSLGIGEVNRPVRSLRTAGGGAFVLSGRGLDELSGTDRLRIQSNQPLANHALTAIASFVDYICGRLTPTQAQVVSALLEGQTQLETAKRHRKSQPTIAGIVRASGWAELNRQLDEYNEVINAFNLV